MVTYTKDSLKHTSWEYLQVENTWNFRKKIYISQNSVWKIESNLSISNKGGWIQGFFFNTGDEGLRSQRIWRWGNSETGNKKPLTLLQVGVISRSQRWTAPQKLEPQQGTAWDGLCKGSWSQRGERPVARREGDTTSLLPHSQGLPLSESCQKPEHTEAWEHACGWQLIPWYKTAKELPRMALRSNRQKWQWPFL